MSADKEKEAFVPQEDEKNRLNESADSGKEADGAVQMDGPDLDSSKVKFINGGADAHVDIQPTDKETAFVGMTKEELVKFATDPYWVRVRWVLFILFWLAWFAMLAAAIVIIVLAPKCPPRPELKWWQKSVVYQVYPRSFQDTDGDGNGDLKGIEQNLEHLKHDLNVTALMVNSIHPSPNVDFGYDITNYRGVHKDFGTLDDFTSLRIAMHKLGMKLILDFVPNHTSMNHTWFQESRKANADYKDYYVWHAGKNGDPPNNWLSVFGDSAWTLDPVRNEFYLHQFLPEQPDLNLRNPKVKDELKDVLKYWLDKGVDGFRVDSAAHLFETVNITMDEPRSTENVPEDDYKYYEHTLTTYQPESYELVTEWRELFDTYSVDAPEKYRFLIVETYGTPNQTLPFYKYQDKKGADMPFNMNLLNLKRDCDGLCVNNLVRNWMSTMPADSWANWVVGNHDNSRVATRMGEEMVNAVSMLLLTLPGTPVVYYGDEIGMVDGDISFEDTQDVMAKRKGEELYRNYSRDPERTPMQWSNAPSAGFTEGDNPWLPVNPDFPYKNVKSQQAHGAGVTSQEVFSSLTLLRQEPSFMWGEFHYAVVTDDMFSYVRQAQGFPGYLVAINFGQSPSTVDFHSKFSNLIPKKGVIASNTANFDQAHEDDFAVGTPVALDNVILRPNEGFIVSWQWGEQEKQEE